MKKLLIISLSVGHGHTRAASAIKKTANLLFPNIEVKHIDFLDFVGLASRNIFFKSYNLLIKNLPNLYKIIYDLSDNKTATKILNKTTTLNRWLNTKRIKDFIEQFQPDYILFTHFTPAEVYNTLDLKIPSGTIITDYKPHQLWFNGNQQNYFVPTVEAGKAMENMGVNSANIQVTGIPIDSKFYKLHDKEKLRKKLNLDLGKKIFALLPSSNGNIDPIDLINHILLDKKSFVLIFTEKNIKLRNAYQKSFKNNQRVRIIGWTERLDEYLTLADVIITKPGGLTISEGLIIKKPIILINPIPGQEVENAKYFIQNNLALGLDSIEQWPKILNDIPNLNFKNQLDNLPASNKILISIIKNIPS